ncbi:hypothetical protein QFC22_004777 [Naganishia vaughanmartiniae]|uniref:Uncharacterized protein n=1 Tax=Naganishia vaughanmartiniae TaxID=1424756 RepID=A0ACC2WZ77_9TREE|nr:hypothetical protein QFC22_004777 [Naganishia vaughanmartiniae]
MPSPSIPAAPTHVIREKAVHHSRRPRSKDDQVSDSRDLKHRVRSNRDLSADAFIGPIVNEYSTPSYHNTTKTQNTRSGPDGPTVAEQILAGREQKMTDSAYRRSLLASPQVRPVSDVVVGLFYGYTLDCGLTEVPVGWTPAEDIRRADEQAAAAARVVADAAAAAKYHRHETAKGKATRRLGEAEIERTRQKQLDMDENEKKREAEHQAHMHQQELDAIEREKKREAEHQAQMQQQKSDHEAFMQRQQEENDERQRQQQQEVDAALAKAADAAARSQREEEAAAEEREKAEHLIKLREILLEQARLEYRRNALAGVLVAAFLAVGIAVYALFLLLKTLLKQIKSSSRGSKESSTGSFQPPDDHPPPPERPSSPATPDQMPPANDPEPPVGDSTPAPDDNDDSAPSPDDDGAPSPDDSEKSDPASNETSAALCDAIPVPQNAVAFRPSDVVPPIDREESQKEAEEQKLEVDMSSEAI